MLGIVHTEALADYRFKSMRRKVFYDFPNGSFPLVGLTSLMDEEACSDPEFGWWEKRATELWVLPSGANMLQTAAAGAIADGDAIAVGTTYHLMSTTPANVMRVGNTFAVEINNAGGKKVLLRGRVTALTSTYIEFVALSGLAAGVGTTGYNTTSYTVAPPVWITGSAFEQGKMDGSSNSPYNMPIYAENYCQIFRSEFSFTGTQLKVPVKFDDSGTYKDKAKESSYEHLVGKERAFIFGQRSKVLAGGAGTLPTYTTGGILWFLEQWEMAGASADIKYRGAGAAALTADTDDNKRIIENSSGILTEATYDAYLERVFRKTNNKANEKLVLCGSGALQTLNQMYRGTTTLNADLPLKDTMGMDVVKHKCPFGTVYYKTHPLFSESPLTRYWMLFVDTGLLKYRYVNGRDDELLKNRQANNADGRTDEYLGECGLELNYPEAFMLIKNVSSWAP